MKTLGLLFCCILFCLSAQAQGQLIFANFGAGVNAPVTDAAGRLITWPSPYVADLFYSSNTNAAMDELIEAGRITGFFASTNLGAGYFFGGVLLVPVAYYFIVAQVRVWDTNYGSTYYDSRDKGGEFGFSNIILVRPATIDPPTSLLGLESIQLQRLPPLSISLTTTNTFLFSWSVWDVLGDQLQCSTEQRPELNQLDNTNKHATFSRVSVSTGHSQTRAEHVLSAYFPMKILRSLFCCFLFCLSALGRGTFRNLDFGSANIPVFAPWQGGLVDMTNGLPGWKSDSTLQGNMIPDVGTLQFGHGHFPRNTRLNGPSNSLPACRYK